MSIQSQKAAAESRIGKQYGYLKILSRVGTSKYRHAIYKCLCTCGNITEKTSLSLTNPKVNCGCITRKSISVARTKHGQCKRSGPTKLYRTWHSIFARCSNPKNKSYKYYGGKGIKVCERWNSFELFALDISAPPTNKHELDRIDPLGHYEPNNCRWVTKQENIMRVIHKRNEKGVFVT
jgi:hypothetical protein